MAKKLTRWAVAFVTAAVLSVIASPFGAGSDAGPSEQGSDRVAVAAQQDPTWG